MSRTVTPVDVLMMRPEQLKKIEPRNDKDAALLDSLEWGFMFHPKEAKRLPGLDVAEDSVVIDWSFKPDDAEDVQETIRAATVLSPVPIAGRAEHLSSLRRFTLAQADDVKNGEYWRYGTNCHISNLFEQN